jgi:hypothetical protein
MRFPVRIQSSILSLPATLGVTDADGRNIGYVRQEMLRLVESVTVFADSSQKEVLYRINADRMLDFSAVYHMTKADGTALGAVKRHGMRSLFRAHYEIAVGNDIVLEVHEDSPWVSFADNLIGEIPFVGFLTGYFLNPTYTVSRHGGGPAVLSLKKRRSIFETEFTIDQIGDLSGSEQEVAMVALMMIILLERSRG